MANFLNTFTLEGGKIITRDNSVGRHPESIHDVQSHCLTLKSRHLYNMDTLLPVGEVIEMKPLPQDFFKYIYKGK